MPPRSKIIDEKKKCRTCSEFLHVDDFHSDKSRTTGLSTQCKECANSSRRTGRPSGRPKTNSIRDESGNKKCTTCSEWKSVDYFSGSKVTSDRLESRCRPCCVKRRQNLTNKDIKAHFRAMSALHKRQDLKRSNRRKAMAADSCVCTQVLIDLWKEQDGKCAVTGECMTHVSGHGRVSTNVSIDRIDSFGGYTRDNIRLVCDAVNRMKMSMTDEELYLWCQRVLDSKFSKLQME